MSAKRITDNLVSAYHLVDLSERILEDIERCPFEEIPRVLLFVRKNLRDAMKYISDAEKEFDSLVRDIDKAEERELLEELSRREKA